MQCRPKKGQQFDISRKQGRERRKTSDTLTFSCMSSAMMASKMQDLAKTKPFSLKIIRTFRIMSMASGWESYTASIVGAY